jgi:dihydroflavonol-4-reductase
VIACVAGATGFIGGHLVRLLAERGDRVRAAYRSKDRLSRLGAFDVEPVKVDALDRGSVRRAVRGCDLVFHAVGYVGSRPAERVWQINAVAPRVAVEAVAAEGVGRVVLTSSVASLGPVPPGAVGDEGDPYRGGGLGLTYADAKHEGEAEALAAGARLGVEVVVVNPTYVLGVPVDDSRPGETSTRAIGNYLRGRLPAVVDGSINVVDVHDVAAGHLRAAERGQPGERYVLGGHDLSWIELFDRVAELSGVRHPLVVLPAGLGDLAQAAESLGLPSPIAAEGFALMAQNWCYSSRKARRELGYRSRSLEKTLRPTIDWYLGLMETAAFDGQRPSSLSLAASGLRLADRTGLLGGLRAAERYLGRRLVAGG